LLEGRDPSTIRKAEKKALEQTVEALQQGDSLVIFPEGTRSDKGDPMPFKSGLFHLAQQFPGVRLVPAWIDNVQRVMPKGEVVPVPVLCHFCAAAVATATAAAGRGWRGRLLLLWRHVAAQKKTSRGELAETRGDSRSIVFLSSQAGTARPQPRAEAAELTTSGCSAGSNGTVIGYSRA
jgi:hypothetical protein